LINSSATGCELARKKAPITPGLKHFLDFFACIWPFIRHSPFTIRYSMRRTYDFATIGFRPFPETQEFVTIGVVALDIAARQFDFVLQDARKTGRVLAMFPKAGKSLYREARAKLETELASIFGKAGRYHIGAGWSGSGEFANHEDWLAAVHREKQRIERPLVVEEE
jgi:hypothetical protein